MKKILVANRGEIAVRICRSATELGLRTVAIYSQEDRFAVHRFKADEAYLIGEGKGPVAAYLDIDGIIALAKRKNVDMIHPGYGFLSENADFAKACEKAGIIFVGPKVNLLKNMGDKVKAKEVAKKAGVPTLPAIDNPVTDPKKAVTLAKKIGFPLIIKAAHGGGGRGMRVVKKERDLVPLLKEAQSEAERAFGNPAVFLERFVGRAKHIEVQVLGDQHGDCVHLFERDCSIQRRYQKVIEIAPSVGLPQDIVDELCESARRLGLAMGYDNAGTVEFLWDMDTSEWFFIEMNPRIQVEHTVTEEVTGVDLVRSQILIAQGEKLHGKAVGIPQQENIQKTGFAVQCRITTEDPSKDFAPDYGKVFNYRSAAGFGVRLDGSVYTGAVITPFYDSLLVKLTTSASCFPMALQRMDRALQEMRVRGVKTNIPFLLNVVNNKVFSGGQATTALIDTTPKLFDFKEARDRASRLLNYLGEVIVNGNEQVKGKAVGPMNLPIIPPSYDPNMEVPKGTRDYLKELGPDGFAQWMLKQKRALVTDTTLRDAHQSLFAARLRTYDMLGCADAIARRAPEFFSLEMWGGATYDTCMRFLREGPYARLRQMRERIPNILFQMLLRGANGVGYSNYPDNVIREFVKHAAEQGIDVFRVFDSLNYFPNMKVAAETIRKHTDSLCEIAICYTGDILNSKNDKYDLKYYVKLAKEAEKMGAHILGIKDMAGLCKPFAAEKLVKTLRGEIGIPIHFHTHDSSGIASASVLKAIESNVDVVDLAISSMSGLTSQPNLNSVVSALEGHRRKTGLDVSFLNELSIYWEAVRQLYSPFDTSPKFGSAEVFEHEMPGGQYTNLREQARSLGLGNRWPEVVRYYKEVNDILGNIVKVTPSSKCVGDLAMFLLTRGVEPRDIVNLEPGTPFPESTKDLLSGGLGQPEGGWPKKLQKVVLGDVKPKKGRPGTYATKIDLDRKRKEVSKQIGFKAGDDELFSSLMYPDVFKEYMDFKRKYGEVAELPTKAFFYGIKNGEEITVDLEEGKKLFIKLLNVTEPDEDGTRSITFELNGRARETVVQDRSIQGSKKVRPKADLGNEDHVGAPIPAVISSMNVSVGEKVKKGDTLVVLEAMKMQTTLYAQKDGIVDQIYAAATDAVDSKDLIIELR